MGREEREERIGGGEWKGVIEKVKENEEANYDLNINRSKYILPILAIVGGIYFFRMNK